MMSRFWLDEGQMGSGDAADGVGFLYHLCESVARTLGKEQVGWQVSNCSNIVIQREDPNHAQVNN